MTTDLPPWLDELLAAQLVAERGVGAIVTNGEAPPLLLRQPGAQVTWFSLMPMAYIGGTEETGWCEVWSAKLIEAPALPALAAMSEPDYRLIDAMRSAGRGPDFVLTKPGTWIEGFAPLTELRALHRSDGAAADAGAEQVHRRVQAMTGGSDDLIDCLIAACNRSDGGIRTRLSPENEVCFDLSPLTCAGQVSRSILLRGAPDIERGVMSILLPGVPPGSGGLELHFNGGAAPPTATDFTASSPAPGKAILCANAGSGQLPEKIMVHCPAHWHLSHATLRLPLPRPGDSTALVTDPLGRYASDPFDGEFPS